MIHSFNNIQIDTKTYRLLVSGEEVAVEPKVFSLIVYLIENRDKAVTREELLEHVWKGRIVSDISINNAVKSARKVLGDDGTRQRIIKTIHSRGYQFVAKLNDLPQAAVATHSNDQEQSFETHSSAAGVDIISKEKGTFLTNTKTALVAGFLCTVIVFLFFWSSAEYSNMEENMSAKGLESKPSISQKMVARQQLAVLPFTNAKPSTESDYLSFALASQIIGDLNYLEKFSLRPAASVNKYANQVIDPVAIGKELQVDYVVGGNYLLENDTVRLNIELIEVRSSRLVWRESMQVDYANTFALQDMVAQKVATGLGAGFSHNYEIQSQKDIPNSALAYEYFLRGISYPQSNDGHKMAVAMLEKSIRLDPQYAPSYAYMGFHRRLLEQNGRLTQSGLKNSEWYYLKALELNPTLVEALSNLSALYTETNRIEEALLITRKVLDVNPNDADSHFGLSYIYRYAGMLDESIAEAEKALAITPHNIRFRSIIAAYFSAGRYDEALTKAYLDNGDYGTGYSALIAFRQGKLDSARTQFKQVIQIDADGTWGLIAKFHLALMSNNTDLGSEVLAKIVDTDIIDAENMYYFAEFYAQLNQKEACLTMLEQAIGSGYFSYPTISKSAAFEFIKGDVRFIQALNRAKERHDQFRADFL